MGPALGLVWRLPPVAPGGVSPPHHVFVRRWTLTHCSNHLGPVIVKTKVSRLKSFQKDAGQAIRRWEGLRICHVTAAFAPL